MSRLELFCSVDDFWQQFAPDWQRKHLRATQLHQSAIMTIVILFHQFHSGTWKRLFHGGCPASPL